MRLHGSGTTIVRRGVFKAERKAKRQSMLVDPSAPFAAHLMLVVMIGIAIGVIRIHRHRWQRCSTHRFSHEYITDSLIIGVRKSIRQGPLPCSPTYLVVNACAEVVSLRRKRCRFLL